MAAVRKDSSVSGSSSVNLTTLRPPKHDPSRKIGAEVFKTMGHACGNEEHILRREWNALIAPDKPSRATGDDVKFVLGVRGLAVFAFWRIEAHTHAATADGIVELLARRLAC